MKINKSFLGILLILFSLISNSVFAQVDSTLSKIDSLKRKVVKLDSVQKKEVKFDTTRGAKLKTFRKNSQENFQLVFGLKEIKPNQVPKVAFMRSVLLPGWGQITNKQYIKLPLIYGAAAGGLYVIGANNKLYHKYKDIILDMNAKGEKERTIDGAGPFSVTLITTAANQYRRYKQLSVIGMSVGWLLFAVEANVAAHLKTFEVSDDISFKLSPSILNNKTLGVKMAFNIK